jgi:hypothetical protein
MISQKKRKKQVIIDVLLDLVKDVIMGPLSPSRTCWQPKLEL